MIHLCWNCYLEDSFDIWTPEHSWDLVLSCLFLEIAITVRDILYLQELVREILDPRNALNRDVGDLKLVTEFRYWCHLLDFGARRWCKKEVDVGDQNVENSHCQQHDVGNIRHQRGSKPQNLKTSLFTYLQVKII